MLNRAIIQRSALESNAMEQLRGAEARQLVEAPSTVDDDPSSVEAQPVRGLLEEQVRRARESGKPPRKAFFLCGPDGGLPGIAKHHHGLEDLPREEWFDGSTLEEKMSGDIHIPYEGVCGADLYVYPAWRRINPAAWEKDGAELDWATANKPCNHLLIEQDLGEPACATRTGPIAGTWWLYSSKAPYKPCSPFHQDD